MGQLNDQSENIHSDDSQAAETILRTVTQDLRNLQQDLVAQLHQDVRRLQAEKSRLLNDIERLQNQQQSLQSQYESALSRQQLAQQQAWAKQLALVLANHLHTALSDRLSQTLNTHQSEGSASLSQLSTPGSPENADRALASLDETVNRAFTSLRQDLNSYQSSLSQQLSRMQDMGQQGEALLEVLVGRISQQLQLEATKTKTESRVFWREGYPASGADYAGKDYSSPAQPTGTFVSDANYSVSGNPASGKNPLPNGTGYSVSGNSLSGTSSDSTDTNPLTVSRSNLVSPPQQPSTPLPNGSENLTNPADSTAPVARSPRSRKLSQFQLGLLLVLLSTLALCLHNVTVFMVGNPGHLFGAVNVGGYLKLEGFGSAILLLWVRMLVVVPLMVGLARRLYSPAWRDIKAFSQSKDRRTLWSVIASGFFLFLSQTLIYVAIGQLGPGVAVTGLFTYPILTVPLAWILFGDRPTRLRVAVLLTILTGAGLAIYPKLVTTAEVPMNGVTAAIAAGGTFALYLVAMQISFRKLHPVPVSLIQFVTMFVFTSVSLIVLGIDVAPTSWVGLAVSGVFLGALTAIGYFFNDLGIRLMGAARAAIIAASVPALTALLAFLLIPGSLTALHAIQIIGILAVTLGGSILGLERLLLQAKSMNRKGTPKQPKPEKIEA